jgi:hypothetical protein
MEEWQAFGMLRKKQVPPLGLKSSVGMTILREVGTAQLKLRLFKSG